MLAELLGPEGFAIIAKEGIGHMENVLARRGLADDARVRDYFVASCAELAIWMQSTVADLTVPLDINPSLMTTIEYKCSTISYSKCGPHLEIDQNHDEYAFLFVSDCWKVRRLLESEDVLDVLMSDPRQIAQAIDVQGGTFAVEDRIGIAKDLTVMLWSAKALTLAGVSEIEARRRLITYALETDLGTRVPGMRIIQTEAA